MSDTPDPDRAPNSVQDNRLRSVWRNDPGALGGAPSRPLTVTSPALEHLLIQAGQLSAPFGERLSQTQRRVAEAIFERSVDLDRVRIVSTGIANAPTTLGNQIRVAPGHSLSSDSGKSTLIHELMHVWQYQNVGTRYITCSLAHQIEAAAMTGTRNAAYFNYQLSARRRLSDYPAEEQAQIVQDYYDLTRRYAGPRRSVPSWVRQRSPDIAHYERLIGEVLSAIPRSQEQIYTDSLMQPPRYGAFDPPTDPMRRFVPVMPFIRIEF